MGDSVRTEHYFLVAGPGFSALVVVHEAHSVAAASVGIEHPGLHGEVFCGRLEVPADVDRQQRDTGVLHCGVLVDAVDHAPVALDLVPRGLARERLAEFRIAVLARSEQMIELRRRLARDQSDATARTYVLPDTSHRYDAVDANHRLRGGPLDFGVEPFVLTAAGIGAGCDRGGH